MLELRNGPRTLKAALGSLNERRTERGSALSIASDRSCGAASSTAADLFVDEGICMMVFFFFDDYRLHAGRNHFYGGTNYGSLLRNFSKTPEKFSYRYVYLRRRLYKIWRKQG
ncbi:hypothetical protein [Collimonas fungivorans]|nr:hypothetical protein [Collimonas fungivorans]